MIPKLDITKIELKPGEEKRLFEETINEEGEWNKAFASLSVYDKVIEIDLVDTEHRYFLAKNKGSTFTMLYRCKK